MNKAPSLIAAIVLGLGISACGYFVGDGVKHLKTNNRYVNVRGLSEKEVRADTAELTIAINFKGNVPGELFPKLEDAQKKIVVELNAQGISSTEINLGQWTSKRTDSFYLKDDPTMPRYNADGSVTIKTHNVAAVEKVVAKLNELQVATDGAIADSKIAYRFNGIGALRAEMIAAATKDARNAALQFATDSGSQVGSISDASQGVFQIFASGSDEDDPTAIHINIMQKKSIYVAYTGGTIGMQRSEQGYIPVSGHLQRQLALMPEFHRPEMPDFTIHEYTPLMDSSDMTPEDWQHIAEDIKAHYNEYDGFVILHGTDTMAYTASALSFMLENLGKPVIVTGSQIPLAELRSDGQINLLNALYVAANYPINEVTLFFNNRLYRGNRTTKAHADGFDAFASPNLPPLLEAGIHIRRLNTPPAPHGDGELIVHPITPQPIGVVTIYPGISADVVRNFLRQPVRALILRSYGVGNAPQNKAFLQELQEASDRGIVVVNLTQCMSGKVNMGGYATGNALAHAGVIGGADMTVEATLTKLHYLLSQGLDTETIRKAMSQNLRGELTPDD